MVGQVKSMTVPGFDQRLKLIEVLGKFLVEGIIGQEEAFDVVEFRGTGIAVRDLVGREIRLGPVGDVSGLR